MIALNILDIKLLMAKLLTGDLFDYFLLNEAIITTYNTFTIDGSLHKDFFDTELQEQLSSNNRTYSYWKEVKGYCYSIIKGNRTPLHFKFVFQLNAKQLQSFLENHSLHYSEQEIYGLYLNFQYSGKTLTCTTGTSMKTFTLDKTLEHVWDDYVTSMLHSHEITCERI